MFTLICLFALPSVTEVRTYEIETSDTVVMESFFQAPIDSISQEHLCEVIGYDDGVDLDGAEVSVLK